jgi:predicted dinucleotide-binding enzyme
VRCLIVGCGCRGQLLARALTARGDVVRGTTRNPTRLARIEAAGAEAELGDPDRVATLMGALEQVAVVCILLASATGASEQIGALHGTRLDMLLTKLVDTTVRGIVYEARGTVDPDVLDSGAERVRRFADSSLVRATLLEADPERPHEWLTAALAAVDRAIGAR